MKIPFIVSALTSLLVLHSHNAFSVKIQNNLSKDNKNYELEDGIKYEKKGEDNKILSSDMMKVHSYSNFIKRGIRVKLNGDSMFYIWNSTNDAKTPKSLPDINLHCDLGKNCTSLGYQQNSIVGIGIESSQDKYGNTYGVSLISGIDGRSFSNKESKFIIRTSYGNFSFGYQMGVESSMRLDASSIVVGDNSNIWVKHLRSLPTGSTGSFKNFAEGGMYFIYNFIFQPGLYTESIVSNYCNFVSNELLSCNVFIPNTLEVNISKFFSELPFRLSYQSQNFMGLKFGISYAPFAYDKYSSLVHGLYRRFMTENFKKYEFYDLFKTRMNRMNVDNVKIYREDSKYKQVLSGGISYTYDIDDLKFTTSIVGEYSKHANLNAIWFGNNTDLAYNDLQAIAVGLEVNYHKLKFAGAYGNLGKSGFYTPKCDMSDNIKKCEEYDILNDVIKYGRRIRPGYEVLGGLEPLYSHKNAHQDEHEHQDDSNIVVELAHKKYSNYYWDMGVGYNDGPLGFSITYFQSNRIGRILKDINVGLEYNFLKYGAFKGSMFSNFHHYIFSKVEHGYSATKSTTVTGRGDVLLLGVKLKF